MLNAAKPIRVEGRGIGREAEPWPKTISGLSNSQHDRTPLVANITYVGNWAVVDFVLLRSELKCLLLEVEGARTSVPHSW